MEKFIMPIILLFLIIFMFILTKRQQKSLLASQESLNKIKVGDKVKTHLGVYGTLISTYESTDGKIAKLDISQSETPCVIDIDFKYISSIDTKKIVICDESGNPISILDENGNPVPITQTENDTEIKENGDSDTTELN